MSRGEMTGYAIGKNIVVTGVKINTSSPFGHLIKHLVCPQKFGITFVFHFSWILQLLQGKLKTMVMLNGGQTRCIMGDVQMANK